MATAASRSVSSLRVSLKSFIKSKENVFFAAEFREVMQQTELHQKIPLNLDGPFIQLYFGKVKVDPNTKLSLDVDEFVCRTDHEW
jgi:hypothetical protein